jgi:hypothetical protein
VSEIAVHRGAVEGDDDDLAAVVVVAVFLFLGDVDDGERDGGDVSVFNEDAGAFQLVPMSNLAVTVADEVGFGVVGDTLVEPVGDAIAGDEVVGAALAPSVDEDMVPASAEPDDRVF